MIDFIEINLKSGDGGFLIHNTKEGREIADELLRDSKHAISPKKDVDILSLKKEWGKLNCGSRNADRIQLLQEETNDKPVTVET